MTDSPIPNRPSETEPPTGAYSDTSHYRAVVDRYWALDEQIDGLIMQFQGSSAKMPPEALEQYRALARERDDVYNEMRELELQFVEWGSDEGDANLTPPNGE